MQNTELKIEEDFTESVQHTSCLPSTWQEDPRLRIGGRDQQGYNKTRDHIWGMILQHDARPEAISKLSCTTAVFLNLWKNVGAAQLGLNDGSFLLQSNQL